MTLHLFAFVMSISYTMNLAIVGLLYVVNIDCEQLFKKPHPQKKLSVRGGHVAAGTQLGFFVSSAASDRLFFHNVDNLRPSMQPLKGEHFISCLCPMPQLHEYIHRVS